MTLLTMRFGAVHDEPDVKWTRQILRMIAFAFVFSPVCGAIVGLIIGCICNVTSGSIVGVPIGFITGLFNGILASTFVRRKQLLRITLILGVGVFSFSLPLAVLPFEMSALASWVAGNIGFWVTLIVDDLGFIDPILGKVRAFAMEPSAIASKASADQETEVP